MTEISSRNITSDSLTGIIFAIEGIKNAVVLLNGPMGCKFYHSTTSQFLSIREILYLPEDDSGKRVPVDYNYLNNWFFRQPRVPCTYLDEYDYVYGTTEKVAEGLEFIKKNISFDLLAIINSPGASLLGDHLKETAKQILPNEQVVILESPGYSQSFSDGYETAVYELLKQIEGSLYEKRVNDNRKRINLFGLSIWDRYSEGDRKELKSLFEQCGIDINCIVCSNSSMEEIRKIPQADLNVLIDSERGNTVLNYLDKRYGMQSYICDGLPIGFSAVEKMISDICSILEADMDVVRENSERARAIAWYKINEIFQMCGLPRGVTFAVEGSSAQVISYSRFLTDYLGMQKADLEEESVPELVFGDANTIAALYCRKDAFCGIEINNPGMGYTDIIPKTHMGIQGALFLIEQILNGLMSKL